jgi:hypothetical protein
MGGPMCLECSCLQHPLPVAAIKTTTKPDWRHIKQKMSSNGLLLNGLHMPAIQSFISRLVLLGPSILAGISIPSFIQLNLLSFDTPHTCGLAILIAVLLQSFSRALPPWTVKEAPTVFRSIYIATGSNGNGFGQMLCISTKLTASASYGGASNGGSCLQESILRQQAMAISSISFSN